MPRSSSGLLLASGGLTIVLVACSSDPSSDDPRYTFKDSAGRTCSKGRSAMTASCDAAPAPIGGCTDGATACFTAALGADVGPDGKMRSQRRVLAVCAACCKGDTASSQVGDCAPVTCTTDADCAVAGSDVVCGDGRCETKI